jgi:hypothetical protein
VLLTALIAGSLAFTGSALAQNKDSKEQPKKDSHTQHDKDHADHGKAHADKAKVGEQAPNFTLADTQGKTWTLISSS